MAGPSRRPLVPVASAVVATLVALAVGFGGGWLARKETAATTTTSSAPPTSSSSSSSTTSSTLRPVLACTGADLAGTYVVGQGAAGTIFDSVTVANASAAPCTLDGYPQLQMLDANGGRLSTTTMDGSAAFPAPARRPPARLRLAPGADATFELHWSDVPVGNETTCASAASLDVYPPGSAVAFNVTVPSGALAPCDFGTIYVSPLY